MYSIHYPLFGVLVRTSDAIISLLLHVQYDFCPAHAMDIYFAFLCTDYNYYTSLICSIINGKPP